MERKLITKKIDGFIHGGDYNPDQWLDRKDILEKDIELMKKAHINCVSLGIFSWAKYERYEGQYDFEWLVEIMNNLYENGIYTILATPSGARPAWLDEKYPEARRCDSFGNREYHKARHNHCMTSPVFREKTRNIDKALAERVKGHPGLIMWHLSNEYGGYCYCDLCRKKFQGFLKKKFNGDIEQLNQQYWTGFWAKKFNSFDEIDPPYRNGEDSIKGLINDWSRFSTENATDFMIMERDTVKGVTPEIPCTTNMMRYFWDYDYRKMSKPLDYISWDCYPRYHNDKETLWDTMQAAGFTHATMRSLKHDQPFMLMESSPSMTNWFPYNKLRRPGIHTLGSLQAIANGSDTVQYFQIRAGRGSAEQFHGAVISHDGRDDTRVFKEVCNVGELLTKISEVVGSTVKAEIGLLYDWDNRWALDNTEAFQKDQKKYEETLYDFYKNLVSIVGDVDVIGSEDDFNRYKMIVAPMSFMVHEGMGEKLKNFVGNGGQLLSTYMLGYVNENQLTYLGGFPGDGLGDLFGIYNEEIDSLYPTDRNSITMIDGKVIEVRDYCEIIHPTTANVLASYNEDFYANNAAITVNEYGKGKAYYVAVRTEVEEIRDLLEKMVIEAKVCYRKVPANVEYHNRGNYTFFLNEGEQAVTINDVSGYDLVSGAEIVDSISLNRYGIAVIRNK